MTERSHSAHGGFVRRSCCHHSNPPQSGCRNRHQGYRKRLYNNRCHEDSSMRREHVKMCTIVCFLFFHFYTPPTTTSLLWTSQVLALYFTLLLSCNILFWFRCGSGWWMHSLPPCCWLRWFCHYGSPSGSRGWQGRQGWGQALLCIVV